ncbi:hypothetical protein [Winogradskyella sp. SYSU M77433]|uniref:hypothetical protein n=1 Tax=Winogradskyella sp. SYSU M77433 TaxID=3042722 RepID=UPI002480EAB8|nr:hypothetical protein [Winogradskyella sp. SYSU M77433]MDH7913185.1 hypothetical protein [Winogradskyella sp. SYSU M77433]
MNFLYFDPGIGAMIIQTIIAAVAGVVLFSKNLMHKIKVFLGLTKNSDDDVFEDIDVKEKDSENSK